MLTFFIFSLKLRRGWQVKRVAFLYFSSYNSRGDCSRLFFCLLHIASIIQNCLLQLDFFSSANSSFFFLVLYSDCPSTLIIRNAIWKITMITVERYIVRFIREKASTVMSALYARNCTRLTLCQSNEVATCKSAKRSRTFVILSPHNSRLYS